MKNHMTASQAKRIEPKSNQVSGSSSKFLGTTKKKKKTEEHAKFHNEYEIRKIQTVGSCTSQMARIPQ
jgi:hypothetical protein